MKKNHGDKEKKMTETINQKNLEIAKLDGTILELENKVKHLTSKNQVEQENIEQTMLHTTTIMNTEKEKLMDAAKKEKELQHG